MHRIRGEQFSPLVRAERDEENRRMWEDQSQARRQFWIFAHANLVAASLWEAQCRCSTSRRPQGDGYSRHESQFAALSKEARDRNLHGV